MAHRTVKAAVAVIAAGALTFGFASSASAAPSTPAKAPVAVTDSVTCLSSDLAATVILNQAEAAKLILQGGIMLAKVFGYDSVDVLGYTFTLKGAQEILDALRLSDSAAQKAAVNKVVAEDLC